MMLSDQQIQEAVDEYGRAFMRQMQRQILASYSMLPDLLLGRTRTFTDRENGRIRTIMERSELQGPPPRLPRLEGKLLSALSPHGVCIYYQQKFVSMGVVKRDQEAITWNSQAMEAGENWEKRGRPWQERIRQ